MERGAVEEDRPFIQQVKFLETPLPNRRIRKVDWVKVMHELDQKPGEWALIGILDRSVRTHIARGRYKYIDPAMYEVTTARVEDGPRNLGYIYMRRRSADS